MPSTPGAPLLRTTARNAASIFSGSQIASISSIVRAGLSGSDRDGLAMLAQQVLRQDPFSGALFAFRGRRGGLVKLLWYDGQGMCLFAKRLERGHFVWPMSDTGSVSLTPAQLSMLLEGIDWRAPQRVRRPELAG
jgi:transposase